MTSLTAASFFDLVWPKPLLRNETLELRLRDRSNNKMRRQFCTSTQEFLDKAKEFAPQYDVYFSLATRFGMNSGTKQDCYRICTTWADVDNKKIKECNFDPKPDVMVSSGGGVHSYWLINSPVLLRGEEERWKSIEAINRGLAYKFHGDRNTIDISRVLRVPGTLNHKFSPAREVKAFAI